MQTENSRPSRGTIEAFRLQKESSRRTVMLGALCFLLPPVGLICLWRSRYAGNLQRFLYSAMALLVMILVLSLTRGGETAQGISPTPIRPLTVGYTQAAAVVQPQSQPQQTVVQTIVYDEPADITIQVVQVYAADGIDLYYHDAPDSHGMVNGRALTAMEAREEGLEPCPECYPNAG